MIYTEGKINIQKQPKVSEVQGMGANSTYAGGTDERTLVQGQPGEKM
jgi:hypothetical protein